MNTFKNILAILLLGVTLTATAQTTHKSDTAAYHKTINDDGKTMRIKITGVRNNKSFTFDKTYHVTGLSKTQREAIKTHVADSLGIN